MPSSRAGKGKIKHEIEKTGKKIKQIFSRNRAVTIKPDKMKSIGSRIQKKADNQLSKPQVLKK